MNPLVEEAAFTAHKLAILQAYPLGTLEVEYPLAGNPYGDTMRRRLNGLNAETGIATLSNETTIWCAHCQPILRPFSSLCTPLGDGTVPAAIAFARSFISDEDQDMWWGGARIDKVYEDGDIMLSIPSRNPKRYDYSYVLHSDWAGLPLEAHSWLVKNHFALPVNGRPLIEGIDFLPK